MIQKEKLFVSRTTKKYSLGRFVKSTILFEVLGMLTLRFMEPAVILKDMVEKRPEQALYEDLDTLGFDYRNVVEKNKNQIPPIKS